MLQRNHVRAMLLGTSGLALVLGASQALAQEALETVIVTAEKQATDIQKTSLSITAIQPDEVTAAGQTRLMDILGNVPSVQIYRSAINNGAYFIRGIGSTQGTTSTLELVDGVSVSQFVAEAVASADASRIEVLRGPQGTLYGRGAVGGLINVITNDPSDKYEGKIFVEGGAYNEVKSQGMVNIPLSDDMAMRIVAVSQQQTGYMHPDGRAGQDTQIMRGKLQYKPSEDFRLVLSGDIGNSVQSGAPDALPQRTKLNNFASPAFGGFNPCGGNPTLNPYDPWHSPAKYYGAFACTVPAQPPVNPNPVTGVCQQVSRLETTFADIGSEADYDFGWANLTVLGSYDKSNAPLGDHAANPFIGTTPGQDLYTNATDKVVEARLSNEAGDWLKWVTGLYWEQNHIIANNYNRLSVTGANAPIGLDRISSLESNDRSVYGQVTIPVVDRFRLIGGLRYSMDDVGFQGYSFNVGKRIVVNGVGNGDFPTHKLTYKAAFEFDVTPDSMLYAGASAGYRPTAPVADSRCVGNLSGHIYAPADGSGTVINYPAGGCQTAGVGAAAVGGTNGEGTTTKAFISSAPPDSMKAYEAGLKNRFFDNKVQLNVDAYYYKFDSLYSTALGVNGINQTASSAQAQTGTKAWGSELEGSFLVTSNDRINLGLSYEKSEIGDSPFNLPNCYNFGTATHPVIEVRINTVNRAACNAKNLAANPATVNWVRYHPAVGPNTPLFNAPTWSGNVGYSHIFDLSSGASVTATATVHFESTKNVSTSYLYDGVQPAFHTTNLAFYYNTADGKWQLGAWVNNVENKAISVGSQTGASTAATDYIYNALSPPRTWGVNLTAKF